MFMICYAAYEFSAAGRRQPSTSGFPSHLIGPGIDRPVFQQSLSNLQSTWQYQHKQHHVRADFYKIREREKHNSHSQRKHKTDSLIVTACFPASECQCERQCVHEQWGKTETHISKSSQIVLYLNQHSARCF